MPTFDQLVLRVRRELRGFTLDQDSVSELTAPMSADDITFTCDASTVNHLSRGLVEIDDELILVRSYDATSGVVSVMGQANGRGAEGTMAAAHAVNSLVTSNPAFPRQAIKDAINDATKALYPSLVVFGTHDFAYNAAQVEYELPVAVKDVWYAVGRWVGPEKVSAPLPNWRFNPQANTSDFPTGKSIQIMDGMTPGQTVRVVYAKAPSAMSSGSDDFATVTGYADRVADLVIWDACKRLLPSVLSARLQQTAVEATERAQLVSTRDVTQAVQTYAALYAEGLQRERDLQFLETPNYATFQGS